MFMDIFGQSATGGHAEPSLALLGRCTAAQPALLLQQDDDVQHVPLTTMQLAL